MINREKNLRFFITPHTKNSEKMTGGSTWMDVIEVHPEHINSFCILITLKKAICHFFFTDYL